MSHQEAHTDISPSDQYVKMPKTILIGASTVDFTFPAGTKTLPARAEATPADPLLLASAMLARAGHSATFMSEAARDHLGDLVVAYLSEAGVDTVSIDRYADGGTTPAAVRFASGEGEPIHYHRYPEDGFNTVWPRVDPDDVVIFGSSFALRSRVRQQLADFIDHVRRRKALIVYMPGFPADMVPNLTHVRPYILEYLEMADLLLTSSHTLARIFDDGDAASCFARTMRFYCPAMINFDFATGTVSHFQGSITASASFTPAPDPTADERARGIAATARSLVGMHITPENARILTTATLEALTSEIASTLNSNTD